MKVDFSNLFTNDIFFNIYELEQIESICNFACTDLKGLIEKSKMFADKNGNVKIKWSFVSDNPNLKKIIYDVVSDKDGINTDDLFEKCSKIVIGLQRDKFDKNIKSLIDEGNLYYNSDNLLKVV